MPQVSPDGRWVASTRVRHERTIWRAGVLMTATLRVAVRSPLKRPVFSLTTVVVSTQAIGGASTIIALRAE